MIVLISLAILFALSAVVTLVALKRAPYGVEDQQGFHVISAVVARAGGGRDEESTDDSTLVIAG